jgi:hypothetical protein
MAWDAVGWRTVVGSLPILSAQKVIGQKRANLRQFPSSRSSRATSQYISAFFPLPLLSSYIPFQAASATTTISFYKVS